MRPWLSSFGRGLALAILLLWSAAAPLPAQQRADPDFAPEVSRPAFAEGAGPVVMIDAAHHNFHTADGRYAPFADLVGRDGFVVRSLEQPITASALAEARILVIANPLSERNLNAPVLPVYSAFSGGEIAAIEAWVEDGGALLLIADHMPWGGASERLAAAFGFLFSNGFALSESGTGVTGFEAASGLAADHPAVAGRGPDEAVSRVMTFTGQAFRVREGVDAKPLLRLGDDMVLLMPVEAWRFSQATPRLSASGMLQGATLEHGAGRVAVFAEAAMFSAQISQNGSAMGMNHPDAAGNAQFALNVMHWLAGLL
jgi:hypothetical protein